MIKELKESYGHLFEDELLKDISKVAVRKEIPEGFKLLEIGDYIKSMPLLISGVIKVLREDHDGDELLLYYLERGETCSMTMSCCLGHKQSEIRAVAETDAALVMVPVGKMEEWTGKYKSWRNFVFESYHNRINELLTTLDSIAFYQMDERLVQYLKKKANVNNENIIRYTHQAIAYDLHTSRVVISRLLKKLEQLEKIELHRNYLIILNL